MEKQFIFTTYLCGYGETKEEAWDDALQGFVEEPPAEPPITYREEADPSKW
jgi:hypothetical protein